jgi:hypothetical protein
MVNPGDGHNRIASPATGAAFRITSHVAHVSIDNEHAETSLSTPQLFLMRTTFCKTTQVDAASIFPARLCCRAGTSRSPR